MTNKTPVAISTPLHHPLYYTTGNYSGECLGIRILVALEERTLQQVLAPTPLELIASYAWIEAYVYTTITGFAEYDEQFGDPYASFGVVIPARFGSHVGGYYAHCFKNKDFGTAPGREAMGFPIKHARVQLQKTGRAVTATLSRPTARMDVSLIIGAQNSTASPPAEATSSPHLLIQSIPSVERDEVLLQQVIKRDVSSSSELKVEHGEPAVNFLQTPSGIDELGWLEGSRPVYGEFFSGLFRGSFGEVLSTTASGELVKNIGS